MAQRLGSVLFLQAVYFRGALLPNSEMTVSVHIDWLVQSKSIVSWKVLFQPAVMPVVRPTNLDPGLADRTRKKTHPTLLVGFYQYIHANNTVWLAELSCTVSYW